MLIRYAASNLFYELTIYCIIQHALKCSFMYSKWYKGNVCDTLISELEKQSVLFYNIAKVVVLLETKTFKWFRYDQNTKQSKYTKKKKNQNKENYLISIIQN